MRRHTLPVPFLFMLILVFAVVGPAAARDPGHALPGSANLLQGTSYEHLLAQVGNPNLERTDKGFFPSLGNYFDAANEGWGLDVQALGNFIFAVWFTYNPDGTPTWFIIVGELNGMSVTGNIESFKWDQVTDEATAIVRGTMTLTWSSTTEATASWTLDGESGSRPVEFIQFGTGPAFANATGHYFDFFVPGWGFTLLTQGEITVMTMYWYKDGQPVWAQGVLTSMTFDQVFNLLYFNGPGLCPSCLSSKGGGFTTTPLATTNVNWAPYDGWPDDPTAGRPVVAIRIALIAPAEPLGTDPFGDIQQLLGTVSAQGITSAFGDNFDSEYGWFIGVSKGVNCVPFQYAPGILGSPPQGGSLITGYLLLRPTDGVLPAFEDANCTDPIMMLVFGFDPMPASIRMGETGSGGVALNWEAVPDIANSKHSENGKAGDFRRPAAGRRTGVHTKGTLAVYGYGGTEAGLLQSTGFIQFFVTGPFIVPPSQSQILDNPANAATLIIPVP